MLLKSVIPSSRSLRFLKLFAPLVILISSAWLAFGDKKEKAPPEKIGWIEPVQKNIEGWTVHVDPALLGHHLASKTGLTFEVITRRLEDRGGGLASIGGRPRLLEGLAMPREEDEFILSYYNSMTTWIDIDKLLGLFGLTRDDILARDEKKILAGIRKVASTLPTYVTLKEVKKRWGHGQEDIFPVTQFEKLWGDLTSLSDIDSKFIVVPRSRGQQLKDPAQLDSWLRDGSANHIESLCLW